MAADYRLVLRSLQTMLTEALFGPFRYDPVKSVLWRGEARVQLGSRALAILGALIETPGRLVSRAELIDRAWPGLSVDESNLKVQVYGLRKALSEYGALIRSEASLGYRFVGEVLKGERMPASNRRYAASRPASMPLGRDDVVCALVDLLRENRLVTILGPGGIGKTTAALAAAVHLDSGFRDGICFVDLARVLDANKVYAAVTGALELPIDVAATIEQVLLSLHGRRLLLILDSCEHLAETVAQLVDRALSYARDIRILTTSREALQVAGEVVWRLDPLDIPPLEIEPTAANVTRYSSVQLFERTAIQCSAGYRINDDEADKVANICRRLDGIPLAIEIAASMVAVLGTDEVRRGIDERFALLSMDRRTSIPRQRSLAATIDWSYNLLPPDEKAVLRSLACFVGPFVLDAAIAVACDHHMDAAAVRNAIVQLANKSLLSVGEQLGRRQYRLLETTRAYACEVESPRGEREQAKARHAQYFLEALERKNWDAYDPIADRAMMRDYIDEVRSALDWAYPVDPRLGIALTLAAEMLWFELVSITQSIRYFRLALSYVESDPDASPLLRARVLVALASAGANIIAPGHDETFLYEQAWEAARITQDDYVQLKALQNLLIQSLRQRRPLSHYLDEFTTIAARSDNPGVRRLPLVYSAYRDVENSDVVSSSAALESFLADCSEIPRKYHFGPALVQMCKVTLSLMNYWRGYGGRARAMLRALVGEVEKNGNLMTLCFALAHGALWCELRHGDLENASVYLRRLEEIAVLYKTWQGLVTAYRAIFIKAANQDLRSAESMLSHALASEPVLRAQAGLYPVLLFELAHIRLMLDDFEGTEEVLAQAMTYCTGHQDARIIGPHHRLLAMVLIARNSCGDIARARELLEQAIQVTRFRGILLFEYEATLELAELELTAGNAAEARQLVAEILDRMVEPDGLPDVSRGREIMSRSDAASG